MTPHPTAKLTLGQITLWAGVPTLDPHTGAYMALTSLEGWTGPTDTTGETTQNILAPGGWDNRAYRQTRYVKISAAIWAPDRTTLSNALDTLSAAIPVDTRAPLAVTYANQTTHIMARQDGPATINWTGADTATITFMVTAQDHRRLHGTSPDDATILGPVKQPYQTGGLTFPITLPTGFDTITSAGRITIPDTGTAPPNITITITGPATNPSIRDQATGSRLWFQLTIDEAQELTIDLTTREILLSGVSRRGARRGRWITPRPGMTLVLGSDDPASEATMTATIQEAWH